MDYKHRVPGYRPRKTNRPRLPWPWPWLAGVTLVFVLILWWLLSDGDESAPAVVESPPPPRTTQLPAPPIPPKAPPEEKKPVKTEIKPEKKAEPVVAKAEPPASKSEAQQKQVEPPPPKPPEPRFSFYKILPEKEVIIPEGDIKSMKQEETQGIKPAGAIYMLQVGSFPNQVDAEKLKTRLSQLKVKSKIETVKIDNASWHRVKIGPFNSLVDADRARAYLRGNQIDSVVQKATSQQ